jgi:mono/diheme cytochrome c family protein
MIRKILVAVIALALSTSVAEAQKKIKKAPIQHTRIEGKVMFAQYCAVCHGPEGTGNGPAAAELTKAPADLTRISARNGGAFPAVKVRRYIEGQDEVYSQDQRDMPLWGSLFRSLDRETAPHRVATLLEHVKTLQTN